MNKREILIEDFSTISNTYNELLNIITNRKQDTKVVSLHKQKTTQSNKNKSKERKSSYDTILSSIFYDIKDTYNFFKSNKSNYITNNINKVSYPATKENYNNELISSSYISNEAREYIHNNIKNIIEYTIKFDDINRQFKIKFAIFKKQPYQNSIELFDKYINQLTILLHFLTKYSSNYCANNLTIYLYLTPLHKSLPKNNIHILQPNNINSAVTTSCQPKGEILIYRNEEWFKVLIHELFHILGFDFSMNLSNTNKYSKYMSNYFNNVNSSMLLYESYCEFWATYINCCFKSFFSIVNTNKYRKNKTIYKNTFTKDVLQRINLEKEFSLYQLNKILSYMNKQLHYDDFLNTNSYSKEIVKNFYREKTNVFVYYIVKSILLYHHQDFILWCNKYNINLYHFNNNEKIIWDFISFIEKKSINTDFINSVQLMRLIYNDNIDNLNKIDNKHTLYRYQFILNTLRMTIYG